MAHKPLTDFERPHGKRRWLQFSLRTLLVIVLLVSVPLSWVANKRHRHRRAVAKIRELGGEVIYSYYNEAVPSWRRSETLRWLLGEDFISGAYQIGFGPSTVDDKGLIWLEDLTENNILYLSDNPITDAGLVHLDGSSDLFALFLSNTKITDRGLRHLARLPNLATLRLEGTDVTDAGLKFLKEMHQLRDISLTGTQVTEDGVKRLQKALPDCSIRTARGFLMPDGEYWQPEGE